MAIHSLSKEEQDAAKAAGKILAVSRLGNVFARKARGRKTRTAGGPHALNENMNASDCKEKGRVVATSKKGNKFCRKKPRRMTPLEAHQ
jgi:photosystem II stability/assembly factor-like uncharacterized protein